MRLCYVHLVERSLCKPENLGTSKEGVTDEIYLRVYNCLKAINRTLRDSQEVRSALDNLHAFAEAYMTESTCSKFLKFLAKLEEAIDDWAFYAIKDMTNLGEYSSNRVEIENSQLAGRSRYLQVGVNPRSELTDTLDLLRGVSDRRGVTGQTQECRRQHKAAIGAGPQMFPFAERQVDGEYKQHPRYTSKYHGRGQFTVRLTEDQIAATQVAATVGLRVEDTFLHTTSVMVHVTLDAKYLFLVCECGYYRRLLTPCRHIFCVKRGCFNPKVDCFPTTLSR